MHIELPLEIRFLKRFARRLHIAGVPAHQIEGMIETISEWLGYHCDIWSNPTAIMMSVRCKDDEDEKQQLLPMQLIRLKPGAINLADTSELYAMGEALISGETSLEDAYHKLKVKPIRLYSVSLGILASGLISGSFAVMLASSWPGAIIAVLAGMLVTILFSVTAKAQRAGGMEAIAASMVTLLVYAVHTHISGIQTAVVIMSGLIVLMPGMSLAVAVTELSTDHLTAGSSRLAGALIVLLKLALGVLIGTVIAQWLNWTESGAITLGMGTPAEWVQWPALFMSAFCFAILFNVRPKDIYLAVLAAVTGYVVGRLGVMLGGVEFGVMLAALVVALMGNLLGRWLHLPASLVRVPGIILLVPGSLGYRAVSNVLLQGSPNSQETAIFVSTMVIALVGGLLIGNTLIPPRRYL